MKWFGRKKDKSEDVQAKADFSAMMNRDEEAERLYREALKADPSNFRAWNNLGCHLGSLNRHQEARDCFFKATQIKADYFEAWRGLAVAEKNLEHYDEALRICDKVEREFGRSMADVREDTERRRRLGIKPPSGNPYDSTTEFARRNAADRERGAEDDGWSKSVPSIVWKMCELAASEKILADSEIKHVPELCIQAPTVVEKVISGVSEDLKKNGDASVPLLKMNVHLAFCLYAGIGAVLEWNKDWPALRERGIYEKLCEKYGIFAMDEYVAECLTGKSAQGPEAKKLENDVKKLIVPALAAVMLQFKEDNPVSVLASLHEAVHLAGTACYWFGVNFGLHKLVERNVLP